MAEKSLRADLNRTPNQVLLIFGDAVRISPNCLRGLFRTAIQTSRPDEGLLEQMILVALNEFPEEANTIAEICFEEAPDKASIIKAAFVLVPGSEQKNASTPKAETFSPIDRFLQRKRPVASAQKSVVDEAADRKIQEAVAKMTANLEGKSEIIPTPKVVLPNALVEEKVIAGKLPPWGGNHPVLSQKSPTEEKSDTPIDSRSEEKPERLPTAFNVIDEITRGRTSTPIVINDQPGKDHDEEKVFSDRVAKPIAEKGSVSKTIPSSPLERIGRPPSVYYIPPAPGSGTGLGSRKGQPILNRQGSIILRSIPVSPTSPK